MNKIVYAGSDARRTREFAAGRKYWQLIKCAARGEVKCAKGNESFMRGNVLAIPPLTDFERTGV